MPSIASAAPAGFSVSGNLQPIAGFTALHIVANGQRAADGTTSGAYRANGQLQNLSLPLAVDGPITCLEVTGSTVSFVYPIEQTEPALVPAPLSNAAAIQITVTKGADGQPNHVGLIGPMATGAFNGCAPGPTPFVFDGDVDLQGG
ncbi:hypothetical protein FOY51_14880 [Antrihabitans cavernicola]|uniref:Uncharacterized protein n=2 Tax=Antrihabitans cavernicola TaxID=2495913 RepID=A0A5A7SCE4_9NOCA|nr:hypothetical protein FOY51_14880 [Spelaeibacter cavernicola]